MKEGKEHVEKLNAHFADWYYVIADDVYQKVHLGRQKIVKKKEKKEEGKDHAHDHHDDDHDHDHDHAAAPSKETFTPADFDNLKKSGVKSP
jgi:ABC-type Zn2+ transport system substrate-binding protein/surface adhesin